MNNSEQPKTLTEAGWQYACRRLAKCGETYATVPLAEAAFHAGAGWMFDRFKEWLGQQIKEDNIEVKHIGMDELIKTFVDEIIPNDEQDD